MSALTAPAGGSMATKASFSRLWRTLAGSSNQAAAIIDSRISHTARPLNKQLRTRTWALLSSTALTDEEEEEEEEQAYVPCAACALSLSFGAAWSL